MILEWRSYTSGVCISQLLLDGTFLHEFNCSTWHLWCNDFPNGLHGKLGQALAHWALCPMLWQTWWILVLCLPRCCPDVNCQNAEYRCTDDTLVKTLAMLLLVLELSLQSAFVSVRKMFMKMFMVVGHFAMYTYHWLCLEQSAVPYVRK